MLRATSEREISDEDKMFTKLTDLSSILINPSSISIILKIHNQEEFVIIKLLQKRQREKLIEYLVFWKGYPITDSTWQF